MSKKATAGAFAYGGGAETALSTQVRQSWQSWQTYDVVALPGAASESFPALFIGRH